MTGTPTSTPLAPWQFDMYVDAEIDGEATPEQLAVLKADPVAWRASLLTLLRDAEEHLASARSLRGEEREQVLADLEVVAQATSVQALPELDVEPDVVVTDLAMPDTPLDQIVEQIRHRFADAAIIALTALDDLSTVQHVLAAGADGYVLKSAAKTDLFAGIRAVARGGLYLQPSIGIAFASRSADELAGSAVGGLTPKETEVLKLLALGHTNAEIAARTGSSLRTIETHRAHIHQKLDLHTRAELVRFALEVGLLRLDEDGARTHPPSGAVSAASDPVPG